MKTINSISSLKAELKKHGFCMGRVNPSDYHKWKAELDNCISKSGLVDFMSNPYVFHWEQLNGEKKSSAALRTGSLIDCLALTPALAQECYEITDADRITQKAKDDAASRGKELVKRKDFDAASRAAQLAHKAIKSIAGDDQLYTQVAIWAVVRKVTTPLGVVPLAAPVTLCGMLDILIYTDDVARIIDLKSSHVNLNDDDEVNRNIATYKYGIQAACYSDLLSLAIGKSPSFDLLYLSTASATQTRLVSIAPEDIDRYRQRYIDAVISFAECCASGNFGDVSIPQMTYSPPKWDLF